MSSHQSHIALAALGSALLAGSAFGQTWTLTKVVESGDTVPGSAAMFDFFNGIALDDGKIVFQAEDTSFVNGIYTTMTGPLTLVADDNTTVPGSAATFGDFEDNPDINGDTLVFEADDGIRLSFYFYSAGVLSKGVDTTDAIPEGTGAFTDFAAERNRMVEGDFAFHGFGADGQQGIYTLIDGALSKVIDNTDANPGGAGNMHNFDDPILDPGGDVVFDCGDSINPSYEAIVRAGSGGVTVVADTGMPVPEGDGGMFDFLRHPWIDGDDVVFTGREAGGDIGLYASIGGGGLTAIIDPDTTPVPGGAGTFSSIVGDSISIENGDVAFEGLHAFGGDGIYMEVNGTLAKVLAAGDMIYGKEVQSVIMGKNGRDGTSVAFRAHFVDNTKAVIIATLDCPGDLDGSGAVDIVDLLAVLGAWGTPDGDTNDDGMTDITDLLAVLGGWGACI